MQSETSSHIKFTGETPIKTPDSREIHSGQVGETLTPQIRDSLEAMKIMAPRTQIPIKFRISGIVIKVKVALRDLEIL